MEVLFMSGRAPSRRGPTTRLPLQDVGDVVQERGGVIFVPRSGTAPGRRAGVANMVTIAICSSMILVIHVQQNHGNNKISATSDPKGTSQGLRRTSTRLGGRRAGGGVVARR
jgi:hypothetical protein